MEQTRSFREIPVEELQYRAESICKRISYFLGRRLPKNKLASFYTRLGKVREVEGVPIEESVMALYLLKRQIWLFILQEGLLTTNLELYQALELNNRIVLYFDRAIYYLTLGYELGAEELKTTGEIDIENHSS